MLRRSRHVFPLVLGCVALAIFAGADARAAGPSPGPPPPSFPWSARIGDAAQFAASRQSSVSFAVVDEGGRVRGFRRGIHYSSASLIKAMILVAYLRRGSTKNRRLGAGDRRLLGPMIRVSDNDAASAAYERVGPTGLSRLARRAHMRGFIPNPVWGGCQVTARDQALFFFRIDSLVPPRHRKYALGLLRRIVPLQRWGIPRTKPPGWRAFFKGGWFPDDGGWRVHQAALLRSGPRRLALAVMTQGDPDFGYGVETIEGVTARLLSGYPR